MKARDKQHFIEAWQEHIKQLNSLGWTAVKIDKFEQLQNLQGELIELVHEIADYDFSEL